MVKCYIKVTIWKSFYKRKTNCTVFLLVSKAKVHAKTLKSTQAVIKIFIKNKRCSVVYFTNFLYRDNNKPISQVKNMKREL